MSNSRNSKNQGNQGNSRNQENSFVKNPANKLTNVVLSDLNFPSLNNSTISAQPSSLNFIEKIKFEPIIDVKIERNPEYVYYTTRHFIEKQEPAEGKPNWAYFGSTWQLEDKECTDTTPIYNANFTDMINNWNKYRTNFIDIYGEDYYDTIYKYPFEETFEEDFEEDEDEDEELV